MKSWVKLYTEINRDPKMAQFTWAQRGIWAALLALAGELDIRNGDGSENGELDTVENTAWRIRCGLGELTDALEAFVHQGMIGTVGGILHITNYAKRQARAPSDRPEATRERKRQQRARESQEGIETVTRASRPVTASESESESDTDTESDQRQNQNQTRVVTPTTRAIGKDSGLRPISDLISSLSPSDSDTDTDVPPKRGPPLTDAARIERAVQIREHVERRQLPAREQTQMRQWATDYGAAALYEATARAASKKPRNFGAYLRKTLEQIGKAREPP